MTRKDYEAIASILKQHRAGAVDGYNTDAIVALANNNLLDNLILDLSRIMLNSNPSFRPEKFAETAGYRGQKL